MLLRPYARVLETCEPYLIARPGVRDVLDPEPLGLHIRPEHIIDPQRVAGRDFIRLVKHVDELAYAPVGLSMPDWVFYDCAVMPGALVGFGRRASALPPWLRRVMAVEDGYDGLVPISMFIAIPMAARDSWLGYSLCSINQIAPGAAPEGLWRLTLAAGSAALRMGSMVGTTRWRSPRLGLYAGLAPLELLTAWTPAHDIPQTLTFRVPTDGPARERLLRGDTTGPEGVHEFLDADDSAAMQALQRRIEAGLQVAIVGGAEIRGAETRVPLQFRDAAEHEGVTADPGFQRRFQG